MMPLGIKTTLLAIFALVIASSAILAVVTEPSGGTVVCMALPKYMT